MFGKIGSYLKKNKVFSLMAKSRYSYYNEVPKFDPKKDYYQILQVNKQSSQSDIKKSYYRLAKTYHPDSNPGKQTQFKQINEAYSVLSDIKLKKQYNAARSFQGFSRRMGSKAKQGAYNPNQYRNMYDNLSDQQRQQILQQMRQRMRKVVIFGLAFIIIVPFLTRRNHQFYIQQNGELIPVQFEGGMAGGTLPPPGMIDPYGRPPPPNQYPNQGGYSGQSGYINKPIPQQYYPQPQQYQIPPSNPYQGYQSPYNQGPTSYKTQSNLQPGYQGPIPPQ